MFDFSIHSDCPLNYIETLIYTKLHQFAKKETGWILAYLKVANLRRYFQYHKKNHEITVRQLFNLMDIYFVQFFGHGT